MRLAVLSGEGSIFLRQCPVDLFGFSWVLLENGVWGEPAGVLPHPCAIRLFSLITFFTGCYQDILYRW